MLLVKRSAEQKVRYSPKGVVGDDLYGRIFGWEICMRGERRGKMYGGRAKQPFYYGGVIAVQCVVRGRGLGRGACVCGGTRPGLALSATAATTIHPSFPGPFHSGCPPAPAFLPFEHRYLTHACTIREVPPEAGA